MVKLDAVKPQQASAAAPLGADVERLLFCGDIHGEMEQLEYLVRCAVRLDCSLLFCAGDFGFWPHYADGLQFLRKASKLLMTTGLELVFIDGNHDNHPLLRESEARAATHPFREVGERIFYAPRAARWSWRGARFLALGGAHSVDQAERLRHERKTGKERTLWWAEERISEEEAKRASAGGRCDVLVCHDCPAGVELSGLVPDLDIPGTLANRRLLERVALETRPTLIVHGHHHVRHSRPLRNEGGEIAVAGLGIKGPYILESWRAGTREHICSERDALIAEQAARLVAERADLELRISSLRAFTARHSSGELARALTAKGLGPLRSRAQRALRSQPIRAFRHLVPEDFLVLDLDDLGRNLASMGQGQNP